MADDKYYVQMKQDYNARARDGDVSLPTLCQFSCPTNCGNPPTAPPQSTKTGDPGAPYELNDQVR